VKQSWGWCERAMAPMQIVGLTGGIACGKSKVTQVLRENHAVRVIDLDVLARVVVEPGRSANRAIVAALGPAALHADGTLNREHVGELVFRDPAKRRAINKATHLPILMELLLALVLHMSEGHRVVVLDAPLLFETGMHQLCATSLVVHTKPQTQVARLTRRDGLSVAEAERRIAAQLPLSAKVARADHLVDNECAPHETVDRVGSALERIVLGNEAGPKQRSRIPSALEPVSTPFQWARLPRARLLISSVMLWALLLTLRLLQVLRLLRVSTAARA
jgi:dephospho-CoA kinase